MSIITKYLPASNTRGSRIKASRGGRGGPSITVSYKHGLNTDNNHARAAVMLAQKMGWEFERLMGMPIDCGYVFCTPGMVETYDAKKFQPAE